MSITAITLTAPRDALRARASRGARLSGVIAR
jgi:hypothetical protein